MRSPMTGCFWKLTCLYHEDLSERDRYEWGVGDLMRKEAEIRLQLRRNGGHRGKLSQEMLSWLNDLERIKEEMNRLEAQKRNREMRFGYAQKRDRAEVKFVCEVKSLLFNASSLLVSYGNNAIDRVAEQLVSPTLVGQSAQSILNQVCDYLTDPMIEIIGLYGVGGVGKTTIIKNVNNLLMSTEMFDKIIWVTLSQSATIESVQNEIAVQLGVTLPAEVIAEVDERYEPEESRWGLSATIRSTRASLILHNLKNLGRCLFLLDDIWVHNFDSLSSGSGLLTSIGFPVERTGSNYNYKVVFTARSARVFELIETHKQIHVAPLSTNEAWDMFVSRSGNQVLDPEIRPIAEEIVSECEGLPINVITVAHAMRQEVSTIAWRRALEGVRSTDDNRVREVLTFGYSQLKNQRVKEGVRSTDDNRVSELLRFGYSQLKNERVRKCFLYCAFFPEDFLFEARELIQYWIAEELVCKESIVASIDDGYQILREITDANMLEPVMRGGDTWVRMHDLFRDLAVSIVTQELGFFVLAGHELTRVKFVDLPTNKKKASLIRSRIHYLFFREMMSATSDLSTLLLRDNPLSYISDYTLFDRLCNLQVLDMSYTGIINLPESVYRLSKLRVLFLQYCTSLEKLSSLEYCKELQFLNLRGTLIKELPLGMEKLILLRSLDLSETVRLENIREGLLSSLYNLEELQMQGSLLCKLESPTIANRLKEIRCLEKLAILTLSAVGFEVHLDTILHLQGHSLTSFSINVYGSAQDYNEDV